MSHAGVLLAILERERAKQEHREAIREAKYGGTEDALRRAHQVKLQSARLLEMAETLVVAVKS
jgi:hypothetical protein